MDEDVLVGNARRVAVDPIPVVNEAGAIVSKAEFRAWMERQPDIGSLDGLLRKVVGKRASQDELDRLVDAVVTACRRAYAFNGVDWRAPLRGEDAQLRAKIAGHRERILERNALLIAAPVRRKLLTDGVAAKARSRYGPASYIAERFTSWLTPEQMTYSGRFTGTKCCRRV